MENSDHVCFKTATTLSAQQSLSARCVLTFSAGEQFISFQFSLSNVHLAISTQSDSQLLGTCEPGATLLLFLIECCFRNLEFDDESANVTYLFLGRGLGFVDACLYPNLLSPTTTCHDSRNIKNAIQGH